jgi:hypothetical protein
MAHMNWLCRCSREASTQMKGSIRRASSSWFSWPEGRSVSVAGQKRCAFGRTAYRIRRERMILYTRANCPLSRFSGNCTGVRGLFWVPLAPTVWLWQLRVREAWTGGLGSRMAVAARRRLWLQSWLADEGWRNSRSRATRALRWEAR